MTYELGSEQWPASLADTAGEIALSRGNPGGPVGSAYRALALIELGGTDSSGIDTHIATGIEATGGDVTRFVNNFEAMLPEGKRWREVERDYDVLDAPLVDEEPGEDRSERYLNGTTRQLFEDVMRSIRSNDEIDAVRLRGLRDAYIEAPEQSRETARNKYLAYALPVYRDLRMLGYTHFDLSH